jgi:hypothetical protein
VLNVAAQQRQNAPVCADEIEERGAATNSTVAQHRDATIASSTPSGAFDPCEKNPFLIIPVGLSNSPQSRRAEIDQAGVKGKSAVRSVVLEIPISPVKGLSSSRTRKIALVNDSAHTNREAMTIRLVWENKVKLTKIALSQKIRIIRNGVGIELPACANNCSRRRSRRAGGSDLTAYDKAKYSTLDGYADDCPAEDSYLTCFG